MKTPDLYDTLGVPRDAKPSEIKQAYRRRATAAHPDKGGSDEALQAINLAYETLADPEKRARYDATGEVDVAAATMSPGEQRFLQALDEVLRGLLSDDIVSEKGVLEFVKRTLSKAKKQTIAALEAIETALRKIEKQLGRYELVEDPVTLRPIEGENFIESRLRAVQADLIKGREAREADLAALGEALICCDRYRDGRPEPAWREPEHRFFNPTMDLEVLQDLMDGLRGKR